MVNLTQNITFMAANVTEISNTYPIKPFYLRFLLIGTILFCCLALLLFFFSKFNQQLAEKEK